MLTREFVINNHGGLHARPATVLVKQASAMKSNIFLSYKDNEANAKSMLSIMSLGIQPGQQFSIKVSGEDEAEAMKFLENFFSKEISSL